MDNVVVAISGHESSSASLRWAGDVAQAGNFPLRVINVFQTTSAEMPPEQLDELVAARRIELEEMLVATGLSDSEVVITANNDPTAALVEYLDQQGSALVVIGSHQGVRQLGGRHLAHGLIHHTNASVAVIPSAFEPMRGGIVLVGVDGSDANRPALQVAEKLAANSEAVVHAVFAYDPMDDTYVLPEGWHRHSDDVRAEVGKIQDVQTKLYMAAGHPTEVLLDHAAREHVSAIVVGTRGRGGFGRLRVGRVPAQLIHHAEWPLIIVHH